MNLSKKKKKISEKHCPYIGVHKNESMVQLLDAHDKESRHPLESKKITSQSILLMEHPLSIILNRKWKKKFCFVLIIDDIKFPEITCTPSIENNVSKAYLNVTQWKANNPFVHSLNINTFFPLRKEKKRKEKIFLLDRKWHLVHPN